MYNDNVSKKQVKQLNKTNMEKFISTIDGNLYLRSCYDYNEGSLIEVTDENGNFLGDFKGSLDELSDDELIEKVEENISH